MIQDRLTMLLNRHQVIENTHLPGIPEKDLIGLQSYGRLIDGKLHPASRLVQFRRILIWQL